MQQLHTQTPVCADCNSPDMEAHALLRWNPEIQDWQIAETSDYCNCSNCGNTNAKMHWVNP